MVSTNHFRGRELSQTIEAPINPWPRKRRPWGPPDVAPRVWLRGQFHVVLDVDPFNVDSYFPYATRVDSLNWITYGTTIEGQPYWFACVTDGSQGFFQWELRVKDYHSDDMMQIATGNLDDFTGGPGYQSPMFDMPILGGPTGPCTLAIGFPDAYTP